MSLVIVELVTFGSFLVSMLPILGIFLHDSLVDLCKIEIHLEEEMIAPPHKWLDQNIEGSWEKAPRYHRSSEILFQGNFLAVKIDGIWFDSPETEMELFQISKDEAESKRVAAPKGEWNFKFKFEEQETNEKIYKIMTYSGDVYLIRAVSWEEAYNIFNPSGHEGSLGSCVFDYRIVSETEVENYGISC